ncbi:MAG: TonB-dependent receptor [Parvularculaceae bacterium]|nr:TonB-dependent receptor [Parvularculaceae bacterium]
MVSSPPAQQAVPVVVDSFRPLDLAQVVQALPGASVAVNSRGESFLNLRARGEREATLVVNGIALRDPWDSRIDLSHLPAGLGREVTVRPLGNAQYASSAIVVLTSPTEDGDRATISAGSLGFARLAATSSSEHAFIALEGQRRDGLPLADNARLESQFNGRIRNNTQRDQFGFYHHAHAQLDDLSFQTSFLLTSARYGVAPEGHVPSEEGRLWQVPADQRQLATVSLAKSSGQRTIALKGWAQQTRRRIDSFADAAFNIPDGRQRNDGSSLGTSLEVGRRGWSLGSSYERQRHEQAEDDAAHQTFARDHYALWSSYATGDGGPVALAASGRVEGYSTQEAGGRDMTRDRRLLSGHVTVSSPETSTLRWQMSLAKVGRLASQRELYGGALGRFVANDDLRPEEGYVGTVSLGAERESWALKAEPFVELWDSVIDQRAILTEAGVRRQRFNAEGYRAAGLDLLARWQFSADWSLQALGTWLDLQREDKSEPLTERPESTGAVTLRYAPQRGVGFDLVARHRGAVRSFDADGSLATLSGGQLLGLEVNYRTSRGLAFARWDNVADEALFPQAGLPEPGRTLRVGWGWGAT